MNGCDMCNRDVPAEVLTFDRPGDNWNIASVCGECRKQKLMPALRRLFVDGGINLNADDGNPWSEIQPPTGAAFFSFETPSGTTHAARKVEEHIASPGEYRCVALCGIEAAAEPEPRSRQLSQQREGVVCERCRDCDPYYFDQKSR